MENRAQKLSTRRVFLLGTAGLALATLLPACTQTTKTLLKQVKEPQVSTVLDRELEICCAWIAKGEHENSYTLYEKTIEAITDFPG